MIESLVTLGLLSELLTGFGVNIASAAAFEWIAAKWRTTGVTNHDLQKALRESYCDALSSIEFGFHRQEGLLDSFGKRRLYREITSNFDKEFLTPFISETSISEDELENLTRDGATYCRILREAVDQLLPKEDISNITIEDLLLTGSKLEDADDLRRLNNKAKADLMASVHSVKDIPELFFDFLDYKDLLIGSLVFFYGEKIKANERVRSIFTHAELQRIREEQSQQYQKQATKLEKALQSQTSTFQQFLSPIKDNFTEVLTCLDRLESEWADTNKYLQRILDLITLDKGLSPKDKKQLEAGLSPSFDLHSKYEFDERKPVGYGAVATVYRAVHRGLRQVRAVKVLKPEHRENQELVERFLREAVVLGSLKHPNIIQIYDAGGGGPNLDFYLEMEYVEGVTLRNFIKSHEFNWQRNLKFIKQLGAAIQKMHESGIIHRDLNPRNIMVDKNGDLKVMDFGVAKIIGLEGLTKDGQVVGTTDYMAPEQARGERVDERADIYSYGVVLYEICTKRLPLVPPLPLRQYQLGTPKWLEKIIEKCLKLDKSQRYSNIQDVLADLRKRELEDAGKAEVKEVPLLSIEHEQLDFTDVKTRSRATKNFTVANVGTGRLTGKITTNQPWLKVSPDRIDLEMGTTKISVIVDTTGLASGFVGVGDISIVTSGGSAKTTVRLSTSAGTKPAPIPMPRRSGRKRLFLFAAIVAIALAVLIPLVMTVSKDMSSKSNVGGKVPVIVPSSNAISKIAFQSYRDGNWEIYTMDNDGSNQTRLTYNPGSDDSPTWSPNSKKIAFVSYVDDIYVINADGSNQTRLTYNQGWDGFPTWSPDGQKVAFQSYRDGNYDIYIMNADGSDQTRLTYYPEEDKCPTWSPDGKKIAFVSYRDGTDIYVMDADGRNQTRLTYNPGWDSDPAWSPDGKKIAFVSYRDNADIYVMDVDGGNQTGLTHDPGFDQSPTWSPDGKKVAFLSDRDGHNEIYIMNADGSNQTQLTYNHRGCSSPTWSPDSEKIAFQSQADFNNSYYLEIYVMDADGNNETRLTNSSVGNSSKNPAWSPN